MDRALVTGDGAGPLPADHSPMTSPQNPLQRFADRASGQVLVLHDATCSALAAGVSGDKVTRCDTDALNTLPRRRRALVMLAVADAAALRRTVSVLPVVGKSREVVCWLAEAEAPVLLTPRAEWPPILGLDARCLSSGAALTAVRLSEPHLANSVLEQLARAAGPRTVAGGHGLAVATTQPAPSSAPPADPGLRVLERVADGSDPEVTVPPDVVLVGPGAPELPAHHVIGRPPTLVSDPDLLGGPLDEGILNPRGYLQRVEGGLVELDDLVFDPARGVTARHVAELRDHLGVRVSWPTDPTIEADAPPNARVLAGLAMAGVPLVSDSLPDALRTHLGPRLAAALSSPADLLNPLHRDEHSVRLRRAALLEHSTLAWRARLSVAAGLTGRLLPAVSIVVATRRPQNLDLLLRQVAKQRGCEVELVLAAHGFEPDRDLVRRVVGDGAVVLSMPADMLFGDVLNAAARAASADLLVKMDDDDWYGPDFITDLLLARHYSGADLVGMAAEYVYLEPLHRTIRRTDDSERTAKFVAGGTMLVERGLLAEAGGFRPVHRFVDAQLLAAAESVGAAIYRTHGLGYVYRRADSGHTWDPGLDFFLTEDRVEQQWDGFVPSRLLEYDAAELPGTTR